MRVRESIRSGAVPTTRAATGTLSGPRIITRSCSERLLRTHQMPTTAMPQRSANLTHFVINALREGAAASGAAALSAGELIRGVIVRAGPAQRNAVFGEIMTRRGVEPAPRSSV